jgi:hypothetical protein
LLNFFITKRIAQTNGFVWITGSGATNASPGSFNRHEGAGGFQAAALLLSKIGQGADITSGSELHG